MKKVKNNLLGDNIKILRERLSLSQTALSLKIEGMSKQKLRSYEENISMPAGDTLIAIAKVLGVSAESLFEIDHSQSGKEKATNPVIQDLCDGRMQLPPDAHEAAMALMEILSSNDQDTILAIKQNLKQFHELVTLKKTGKNSQATKKPSYCVQSEDASSRRAEDRPIALKDFVELKIEGRRNPKGGRHGK